MNVLLTFDIEVWCKSWDELDSSFPGSFERYIYGRSRHGEYALPETLAILNRHGLQGVFFVEPLFAARFGIGPLERIVSLIRAAGQQVQLHLHPEWTDEALQPLIPNCSSKRQHLCYYSQDEQTALIGHARALLEAAGSGPLCAFRAGSYAANRDTFAALRRNGLRLDTSLNRCHAVSGADLAQHWTSDAPFRIDGVSSYPVTVFKDGFGRLRPAQVGACSANELRDALSSAESAGNPAFVIVSHNFEMLRAGSSKPDWVVARRFEALCAYLAGAPQRFKVRGFGDDLELPATTAAMPTSLPSARVLSTAQRHAQQLRRRCYLV
jgi:peptidoglycan/xylan/chitin deacetylase (PgdA/CDA1 family)